MNNPNLCSICGKPAAVRLNNPERRLCAEHFIKDAEERVFKAIDAAEMIREGDRVLVGLSGGKDSTALILILSEYVKTRPDVKLIAVTIDEGIAEYREDTIKAAERLVEHTGVEHGIISFTELFGDTLDRLVADRKNLACSICGVLRRRSLTEAARRFDADSIATGHNLDDEAQSVLMNMLRGDKPSLIQDSSLGYTGYFVPRIKPLAVLSEKEIVTYIMLKGFYTPLPECPYAVTALRMEARKIIGTLEERYPGTKLNIVRFRDGIRKHVPYSPKGTKGKLNTCKICGELTSGEICQVCRVLNRKQSDE
ncbi:TIGR00269 family protein [Methanomicrobium mobile]|uniref:TIGR00269 family protein n=1 Tax=Methanomicrobium mobile TaxID=2205 RepID=UPI0005B28F9D|nr:TIGR00269 family protein [Methanomicrobium mobile]